MQDSAINRSLNLDCGLWHKITLVEVRKIYIFLLNVLVKTKERCHCKFSQYIQCHVQCLMWKRQYNYISLASWAYSLLQISYIKKKKSIKSLFTHCKLQ